MSALQEIPLKVLWIYNCYEQEQAIDFYLEEGGKSYQVKGSDAGVFNPGGKLRICLTENLNQVSAAYPNRSVLIVGEDLVTRIWNYWKYESGELRYNSLYKQWEEHHQRLQSSFFDEEEKRSKYKEELIQNNVELTQRQIYDLVFELEALVEMQRVLKGSVSEEQVTKLINLVVEGFSESTRLKIMTEVKRCLNRI
jgi:hypothetical protein